MLSRTLAATSCLYIEKAAGFKPTAFSFVYNFVRCRLSKHRSLVCVTRQFNCSPRLCLYSIIRITALAASTEATLRCSAVQQPIGAAHPSLPLLPPALYCTQSYRMLTTTFTCTAAALSLHALTCLHRSHPALPWLSHRLFAAVTVV